MAAIVEGTNNQVTIYKDGQVSTAQEGRREGETASELNRKLSEGWSLSPQGSTPTPVAFNPRTASQGYNLATTLFGFMPEEVLKAYAAEWVKSGDSNTC
jgi:hypothetical protein